MNATKWRKNFGSQLKASFDATKEATDKGYKELRPEETAMLASDQPMEPAMSAARDILGKMKEVADTMRQEPEIYASNVVRKLELAADRFPE